jgi:four helix bundle protein
MKNFRDLKVWEKSHRHTLDVYRITKTFPAEERYGVISQLRRAAVSIPTNIAEGCGRKSEPDFSRFLEIAFSSACEVEYLLLLSKDLGYLPQARAYQIEDNLVEIKRMLSSLMQKLTADR